MTQVLKWGAIMLVGAIASLFLLTATLRILFPPAKLRTIVEQQIGSRLHRQVEIGAAQFSFSGLTLDSLRLSDIPNFKTGTFLTIQGLRLHWDLRALWQGLSVQQKFLTKSRGNIGIDHLQNPNYEASNMSIQWALEDMDPTWKHLNGWARLRQGSGRIQNIDRLAGSSSSAKLFLAPLEMLSRLDQLGVVNLGLPDFNHLALQTVSGDYKFTSGTMTIHSFEITSPQISIKSQGWIELGTEKLAVDLHIVTPGRLSSGELKVDLHLGGSLSHPKVDMTSLKKKAFKAILKNVIDLREIVR